MPDLAPVLTGCHVCRSPMVDAINGWLRSGVSQGEVSRRLKESGNYVSRITIGKHERLHLTSPFDQQRKAAAAAMKRQQRTIKGPSNRDLAVLVRDEAVRRLDDGELEVTLTDGLRAQGMLDSRAEKGADRDLILQLGNILGGGYRPPELIEGEYRVLDDEAQADATEFALLTAG